MEKLIRPLNSETIDLPEGVYKAIFCGYTLKIFVPQHEDVIVKTKIGIRGEQRITVFILEGFIFTYDL